MKTIAAATPAAAAAVAVKPKPRAKAKTTPAPVVAKPKAAAKPKPAVKARAAAKPKEAVKAVKEAPKRKAKAVAAPIERKAVPRRRKASAAPQGTASAAPTVVPASVPEEPVAIVSGAGAATLGLPEEAATPVVAAAAHAFATPEQDLRAVADEIDLGLVGSNGETEHDESWIDAPVSDISVADVLAGDEDDEQDDEDGDDEDDGDEIAAEQDEDDDDRDDQDEEDEDDTPLGESMPTDVGGGLDPAVAAAARRLGIQRLYPEQERGIRDGLAGRDVLIVMPTGFGKSACYQVPSMVLPKPTVLISPLLALLRDQHEKLIKYNVPCVRLDGTVRGKARTQALARIAEGGSLLVMTTPETLGSEEMAKALTKSGISLAAIDEAHCISEWGFDFRPAYLRLGETLRKLGRPPLLALTATATEKVRTDIVRFLGMREPTIVASSPHRSNLAFEVLECKEATRLRALARLAQRLRRPGIIYCSTTRDVDTVYTILNKIGIPTHRYHGKMAAGDRVKQQELYMKPGRRTVMVATSAFGLGIDKPDIRYVVHQQSPASLEQYVQEAGRAGRDGAKANCILLHDPSDRAVHEALLSRSRLRPDQLYKLGSALAAWSGEGRTPTIDALALSADLGERPTNALLATLEEAALVHIAEDQTVRATVAPAEVEEKVRSLAGQFANMRTQDSRRLDSVADYAQDTGCRAVYLRSYFGEEHGGACGLCDVCRGRPERPSTFWSPVATPKRMAKKRRRGRSRNGQPQPQPQPQANQGRRRRGRGGPNRHQQPRGGMPGQLQFNPRGGAPGGQAQQHPQPQQNQNRPQQNAGGPPRDPNQNNNNIDPNTGLPRSRSSRRRRRRGRRGRRGRPNPTAAPPTPSGEG